MVLIPLNPGAGPPRRGPGRCVRGRILILLAALALSAPPSLAGYTNFESSHVHPVALTSNGGRLLVVNTPDATLEVFAVLTGGDLLWERAIPVGLEPVSVRARDDTEAWVVNRLSDTVSAVDVVQGIVLATHPVGDEPSDVAFAGGRAFVAVGGEDRLQVIDLGQPPAPPQSVPLFGRSPRALAVSTGSPASVYAVVLRSGNQTTVVGAPIIFGNNGGHNQTRMTALGLHPTECDGAPPPYPPLPPGIVRNPALTDPTDGVPRVGLIVRWNEMAVRWEDEMGADWTHCLPFRLPDRDLFVVDAASLSVTTVAGLGTSLFEVSVRPTDGRIYAPHTEARNFVRFEHALGVQGHVVDNRMAVVNLAGPSVTLIDLNAHVDRVGSPSGTPAVRQASVSQPGMMAWKPDGSAAYLTAIGSRKLFRVDGGCLDGGCIFGPDRAAPQAVVVGEGPTGVAFHEGSGRLYVLNRFSQTLAVVDEATLTVLDEVPLHDPSPAVVKDGRRFLYDAQLSSAQGDAACSSCHLSGDLDGQSWDLGDPTGDLVPYSALNDNVRFIVPVANQPTTCDPSVCAAHQGFDPQKGPMATQTLRGMLEPLHWRGDRATFNDFNPAFVGLLGKPDQGPVNGKPAGLSAADMEMFRQFTLGMRFPPNPYREVDDTLPNTDITLPGLPFTGNPRTGRTLFSTHNSDAGQTCASCHAFPFGAAGGQLGGVTPAEPTSPAATALFNGTADGSLHSDLEVPHLRNMYEKVGLLFGPAGGPFPDSKVGFGFVHDGAIPDMGTFLSLGVFNLTATQVRHLSAFMYAFPTGTLPAVGRHLTVPAGAPPTGTPQEEALLAALVGGTVAVPIPLGDLAQPARHCELVAAATLAGTRRLLRLEGGLWRPDAAGDAPLTTSQLRTQAQSPVSFLCAPIGSGVRLGGDRDEDGVLNGDDCAAADPGSWSPVTEVQGLAVAGGPSAQISWTPQAGAGPGVVYDLMGGSANALRTGGLGTQSCLAAGLGEASHTDSGPLPAPDDAWTYLARARNGCGAGGYGAGRGALDALACP